MLNLMEGDRCMIAESILKPELLKIVDAENNTAYYGCNQEWYKTPRQREAGCGPSVASNIIFYLTQLGGTSNVKEQVLRLMEESWDHVTPGAMGIPTTKMFCEAMDEYMKVKSLLAEHACLDIGENKKQRPPIEKIIKFIEFAINKDAPVAFLNLCNGEEVVLDAWHWVTIISMNYSETCDQVEISIIDNGELKKINLLLWYQTTKRGGGFVYFVKRNSLEISF